MMSTGRKSYDIDRLISWFRMPKDKLAVLVNAQRFLLSLKKQNPWEGEINYFKLKNKEMIERIEELKKRIDYLENQHVISKISF